MRIKGTRHDDSPVVTPDHEPAVAALTRTLAASARNLSAAEARYLVFHYYQAQEDRIRSSAQLRALNAVGTESNITGWLTDQHFLLEKQIKRALDGYTRAHPVGDWLRGVYGIGPVLAAGLLAHLDITRAPTAGHFWSFAGLNPTVTWEKGQKRPWNADLKKLCWKVGESFFKFHNNPKCFYGSLFNARLAYEVARNDRGDNAETAARTLAQKNFRQETEAYGHLVNGRLPPAQLYARAKRWATKIFLAHLHAVMYELHYGEKPPIPYAVAHMNHAHTIGVPAAVDKSDDESEAE